MATLIAPEVIAATLDRHPDLLFKVGQMLSNTAGPWDTPPDGEGWVRYRAIPMLNNAVASRVWKEDKDSFAKERPWCSWHAGMNQGWFTHLSAEEARADIDAELRKEGWRLA